MLSTNLSALEQSRTAFRKIQEACTLYDADTDYRLDKLGQCVKELFERFSPRQIGDRVTLLVAPEITGAVNYGWSSAKHFLVPGAVGTVRDLDFAGGLFRYDVTFDDESDRDSDGRFVPSPHRHVYTLSERVLGAYGG